MKLLIRFLVLVTLTLTGMAARAGTPACVRENGCSVPSCYSAPSGAIYYACDCNTAGNGSQQPQAGCTAGSDSNNGTSPSTPFQTYDKAESKFASLNGGDAILFCNGGVFNSTGAGSTTWSNANTSAGSRATIGHYAAPWGGGGARPLVIKPVGAYGFAFEKGSDVTSVGGYILAGIRVEDINQPGASICAGADGGVFVYNRETDIYLCDLELAYNCIGVESAGGNSNGDKNTNIVRQYLYIHDNPGQGDLGDEDGAIIDSSLLSNNGFSQTNTTHNLYWGAEFGATNVQITNNELTLGTQTSGGGCQAVELVMHGLQTNVLIRGNWIHEAAGNAQSGCYGIGINPGYTATEQFLNFTIDRNVLVNMGGSGINVSACHNCAVNNNLILAAPASSVEAISFTNDGTGSGGADWDNATISMLNNTAYGAGVFYSIRNTGSGFTVLNNVTHRTDSGTVSCFDYQLSVGAYTAMDHNFCYAPSASTVHWTGSSSLATWQGNGFDLASTQGTNTNFTNARISTTYGGAASDFTPAGGSALIAAGSASGALDDFFGVTRPNPPSIGALESASVTARNGARNVFGFFGGLCLLLALGIGVHVHRQRQHHQRHELAAVKAAEIDELEKQQLLDSGLASDILAIGGFADLRRVRCPDCNDLLYVTTPPPPFRGRVLLRAEPEEE